MTKSSKHSPLIIFDMDGVLIDSVSIGHTIIAKSFTALGQPLTMEESLRIFSGSDEPTFKRLAEENFGIKISTEQFKQVKKEIYETSLKELKPLNQSLLIKLKENNINYCLASNNGKEHVKSLLEIAGQSEFFTPEQIFTSELVANGKPAPDIFLYAAESFKTKPEDCIIIEDSLPGVKAGLAAKMKTIAFFGASHAAFEWYQERIKVLKVESAESSERLQQIIGDYLYPTKFILSQIDH